MAAKKQIHKRRTTVIPFIVIAGIVIALLWLATMQLRINSLTSSLGQLEVYNVMHDSRETSRQRLTINPEAQRAYIPSANLKMPYSPLLGDVVYNFNSSEDLSKSGSVSLTTAFQAYAYDSSEFNGTHHQPKGCFVAFVVTLNDTYEDDHIKEVFTKTLGDGRTMTVLESTASSCTAFTTGSNGQDIVKALRKAQSY